MTAASSFVDEMATLLAEVNARLEGIIGKPLCFALAVVHGDDGKGAFWYTSPNDPTLLSEPLADTLSHHPGGRGRRRRDATHHHPHWRVEPRPRQGARSPHFFRTLGATLSGGALGSGGRPRDRPSPTLTQRGCSQIPHHANRAGGSYALN
jgi:hypothetical protein